MFSNFKPKKENSVECPKCNEKAKGVLEKTLQHLLTDIAKSELSCFDGFYYCKTPSCEVVYFRNNEILTQKDVSIVVGLKTQANPATVCYCFQWSKEKITKEIREIGHSTALKDIKHKMDTIGCSCESLNPSGSCCLGDIAKAIKEIES